MCLNKWSVSLREISPENVWTSPSLLHLEHSIMKNYTLLKRIDPFNTSVKRLQWAGHVVRMLVNKIPKWILGGSFRGWPARKTRNRWEAKVWKNVPKFLNTKNWRAAATHSSEWRKKIGESMARKWVEETKEERGEGPPLPYTQKFNSFVEILSSLQILPFNSCKKYGLFR